MTASAAPQQTEPGNQIGIGRAEASERITIDRVRRDRDLLAPNAAGDDVACQALANNDHGIRTSHRDSFGRSPRAQEFPFADPFGRRSLYLMLAAVRHT
jgi:hypothetical protein